MNLVVLGRPGSGKGTQATRLAAALELELIATSALLLRVAATETPTGKAVQAAMTGGRLVDDALVSAVVGDAVRAASRGVLLEGFPRTVAQCEALPAVVAPDAALEIDVPAADIIQRLRQRLVCSRCGDVGTVEDGPTCAACGSLRVRRSDDDDDVVQRRLWIYERDTAPVATWFERRDLLVRVDGRGSVDDVAARLLDAVSSRM